MIRAKRTKEADARENLYDKLTLLIATTERYQRVVDERAKVEEKDWKRVEQETALDNVHKAIAVYARAVRKAVKCEK